MQAFTVSGGGGVALHGCEWGRQDGPALLLVHGWSQALQCWSRQYDSELARDFRIVAFDLRGHGASAKPMGAGHYEDGDLWAADLAAVIAARGLQRPVLAGWSYGGIAISDYLRVHGSAAIAGINFVCAAIELNESAFGRYIGPGFLEPFADATCDDLARNIDAMRRFVRGCFNVKLPREDYENCLCWNMVTPPAVRGWLGGRELDFSDTLAALDVPVLVTQGAADNVVLPAMAERIDSLCRHATLSLYEGVGHAPFLEAEARFNRELADFAMSLQA